MHDVATILDDAAVRASALAITVEQYHRLSVDGIVPQGTELIQGVIIEQMTKSPLHTFLVSRLAGWLAGAVPPGSFLRKKEPLTLAASEPEPDIAVVRGTPDDYRSAHPATADLVIEVAIATLGIDRVKADVYAAADVGEYWIVVPESRRVEIHRHPSAHGYGEVHALTGPDDCVCLPWPPATRLALAALFG